MPSVQDIAALLAAPPAAAEPPMGALAMVQAAREQLATQPQRMASPPLSDADAAAMMPETYVNPAVQHALGSLASLPKRAIEGAAAYRPGSGEIPDDLVGASLETAMLPMGTGAIAGVPVRAGEAVLGAGPIRAYHGSPHDFDKFSLDKIGTGEGAQAYGHGLYFAENEGVARSYRSINAPPGQGAGAGKLANDALQMARDTGLDGPEAKRFAMEYLTNQAPKVNALSPQHYYDAVNNFDALTTGEGAHGRMYEVNINADPEHFLDWDKPLSEQHPQTQEAVKQAMGANWDQFRVAKAGDAVKQGFIAPGEEATAARLRQAGIPGIKYLDQGSRAAGDGSRNYVLFDDNLVNIARKYGMGSVAALPPALAALSPQPDPSQ